MREPATSTAKANTRVDSAPNSGLRVRDLSVDYGRTRAVRDVNVAVPRGEVLAVLGPSGCGKSTLLRAVAGLERPSVGGISFDGTDLDPVPVHRRGFGMVFQDGQLFPHRDVAGNVEFGPRMRSVGRARRARRVAEVLQLVGLAGFERRRVTELSGGQAQRVALARALAADPRLLLLDEPLAGLDRMLREQLAVDLARMLDDESATAIVVTHDHDEAFTLADSVAVMVDGRILQVDEPRRLWRRPANEDVAAFLGCTTILPAHLEDGVASCVLGSVSCPDDADTGRLYLGLRASGVRARRIADGEVSGQDRFGVVRELIHRHDHARLAVSVPLRPELGMVEAVATTWDAPTIGEKVGLTLDPEGIAVIGNGCLRDEAK